MRSGIISRLNLVLTLDSKEYLSDVAFLVGRIESDFYRHNGIKANTKFRELADNLVGASNLENAMIAEIFPTY